MIETTTATIVCSIITIVIALTSAYLTGAGNRSELEQKVFELKAKNYMLNKKYTELEERHNTIQQAWCNMKSTLPLNISKINSQEKKSGETSS